ncbi:hypothetical protein [Pseudomonas sp. CC6-YY-74]|uniref:hypothetical protein n=1 Tax=Pseudomonas sp. CC6-YY-74 TaxID=1930532 RepID=UPI003531CE47
MFGIIKLVMGFRQFLLRSRGKVSGEWRMAPGLPGLEPEVHGCFSQKTRHLLAKTSLNPLVLMNLLAKKSWNYLSG